MAFDPKAIFPRYSQSRPYNNSSCNYGQSSTFRQNLTKAAAYTTGIVVACASLYSLTDFSQKAINVLEENASQTRFLRELKTDPRFENGYIITKLCFEHTYGEPKWEK
jgi:hypothetical protein